MKKTIEGRLTALEQAKDARKGVLSVLIVRPNGQTPVERAAFDVAIQQYQNEGYVVSAYDEDDPTYTADLERFLG